MNPLEGGRERRQGLCNYYAGLKGERILHLVVADGAGGAGCLRLPRERPRRARSARRRPRLAGPPRPAVAAGGGALDGGVKAGGAAEAARVGELRLRAIKREWGRLLRESYF